MDHEPPMGWDDGESTFGDEPADDDRFDHDPGTGFEADGDAGTPDDEHDDEHGDVDYPAGGEAGYDSDQTALGDEFGADHADPAAEDPDDTTDDPELPEPVSGAHPDLDLVGDDPSWASEDPFPPQLDIGEPPEPVDGFPWSDPAVLGEAQDTGPELQGTPEPADLADYDHDELPAGADPWQTLAGSDDPATSSLARWWAPSG